jgi:hypothetical protein
VLARSVGPSEVVGDGRVVGAGPPGRRGVQKSNREQHRLGDPPCPASDEQLRGEDLPDRFGVGDLKRAELLVARVDGRPDPREEVNRELRSGDD